MGIEIERDRNEGTLTITQADYIKKAAATYLTATTSKTFSSPVHTTGIDAFMKIACAANDIERAQMRVRNHNLALMGTLLWATITHPECAYYVAFLCQFMHDPSLAAWEAALAVLCYLNHAQHIGITYCRAMKHLLKPFSDSSWGQVPLPFGGHAILFCVGAISWSARKLKISPQSSAEAEYAVYATCAKDLKCIIQLLQDLGVTFKHPVQIFCDSKAAIATITNIGATARNRHFERWMHIGREQFLSLFSIPIWISTKDMIADANTKALDKTTFLKFRAALLNLKFVHSPTLNEILLQNWVEQQA